MVLGARSGRTACEKCGGCLRTFILFLGGMGIAFSILCAFSCSFVTGKFASTSWGNQAGLFFWKDPVYEQSTCEFWPSDNSWEKFIRIAAILAPMFAVWAGFIIIFQMICCNIWCVDAMVSGSFLAATVCQGCTFFMFWTDHCDAAGATCEIATGGHFSITSMCFYFVASILICCSPKTEPWMMRDYPSQKDKKDEENPPTAEQAPPPQQQQQPTQAAAATAAAAVPPPNSSSLNSIEEIPPPQEEEDQQHYNEHHTNPDMDIPSPTPRQAPPPPPQPAQKKKKKKPKTNTDANNKQEGEGDNTTTPNKKKKKKKKVPPPRPPPTHPAYDPSPPSSNPPVIWPEPIEDLE